MAETQTQPAFQLKSRAEMYLAHNHINELIASKPNGLNRADAFRSRQQQITPGIGAKP
jgi:hypothetical protein